MKLSVIVPVYNTEEYLERCLDSLINQTLQDIEILVVDDGSTDGSLVICNVYSQSHISVWQFWIEFNDHGRLSGDWTHWHRENTQSDMVESVADQISEAIKTRYQEIRDQQDQR